jgi:hydroxypyruvate isomerase
LHGHLRYAPHLGYRPPFEPLFAYSARAADVLSQIDFAADSGFAGVLHAAARNFPEDEQARAGVLIARRDLAAGCVLYTTFDKLRSTVWADEGVDARMTIADELRAAFDVARRLGSTRLAILGGAEEKRPLPLQHAALIRNLRHAADLAEQAGMVLCLETIDRERVPGMLLHHLADALRVVRAVDRPSVRLIFDTAHVQAMDDDAVAQLESAWDAIEIVQIADHPGRFEPGSGGVDFEALFRYLGMRGYRGLVELEHGWRAPGTESERLGIETLRRLDAIAAAAAS